MTIMVLDEDMPNPTPDRRSKYRIGDVEIFPRGTYRVETDGAIGRPLGVSPSGVISKDDPRHEALFAALRPLKEDDPTRWRLHGEWEFLNAAFSVVADDVVCVLFERHPELVREAIKEVDRRWDEVQT